MERHSCRQPCARKVTGKLASGLDWWDEGERRGRDVGSESRGSAVGRPRTCWRARELAEAVLTPCPFLPSRCHCNFFGKRVEVESGTFFVEARAPRRRPT
jgi:hypothetical protein